MIVERWGNTLALRLPRAVVEALELNEGDDVIVEVAGPRHLSIACKPAPADLIARLKK
jgi:antitoxin MazE